MSRCRRCWAITRWQPAPVQGAQLLDRLLDGAGDRRAALVGEELLAVVAFPFPLREGGGAVDDLLAGPPTIQPVITESGSVAGSRPCFSHSASRRRAGRPSPPARDPVLYSLAQRTARRRLRGPPEPPMINGGRGRCTGFGCASSSAIVKCLPSKLKAPSSHCRAISQLLFEGVHARPERGQVEAVGIVLALPPPGAEPGLDPAAADLVDGHHRLGEDRGMAEGRRRDHRPQPQLRGDRGERRQRRPGVERAALAPVLDREVVVGAEERADAVRSQASAIATQSAQVTSSCPSIIRVTSTALLLRFRLALRLLPATPRR